MALCITWLLSLPNYHRQCVCELQAERRLTLRSSFAFVKHTSQSAMLIDGREECIYR